MERAGNNPAFPHLEIVEEEAKQEGEERGKSEGGKKNCTSQKTCFQKSHFKSGPYKVLQPEFTFVAETKII